MARFSEEEIETLCYLVEWELREVNETGAFSSEDIYLPYLQNLLDKLQKYQDRHYPTEE